MTSLRVIDFSSVSGLRSQSLWHGIAKSMRPTSPITLTFMRPSQPYVGIGLHRSVLEINRSYISKRALPVIRRQVGGGPVYLDSDQLFFQVCAHRSMLPRSRSAALDTVLRPMTRAFQSAGVEGSLDASGEFSEGVSKICGHGAGEIDEGIAIVGNLIEKFDHQAAAQVLDTSSSWVTRRLEDLMRKYVAVGPREVDPSAFMTTAASSLANALSLPFHEGDLDEREWESVEEYDQLLSDDEWTRHGEFSPPDPKPMRVIKIRADVFAVFRACSTNTFYFSSAFGKVDHLYTGSADLDSPREESQYRKQPVQDVVNQLVKQGFLSNREVESLINLTVLKKEVETR